MDNFIKSQFNQDVYLIEKIYDFKKNGYFVEIGAYDGINMSNTYLLEYCYDWKGILVECNPYWFSKLIENRPNCININCAICNNVGTADFICNTGYTEMISGLKDNFDIRHLCRLEKENNQMGSTSEIIKVNTTKIESICDEYNIKHINYLSIDVEGAEFEVIKSINFDNLFIDVIGFENNYNDVSVPIIKYLEDKNYIVFNVSLDIFMIHNNSIFINNIIQQDNN